MCRKTYRRASRLYLSSYLHDGSGPLTGRLRTNGLGLCSQHEYDYEQSKTVPFTALPSTISRLNHRWVLIPHHVILVLMTRKN